MISNFKKANTKSKELFFPHCRVGQRLFSPIILSDPPPPQRRGGCVGGGGHCGYRCIKHRGGGRREEVSLILRGNWSLPTVHMGHTPYMGCFPFQWWVGGGRLAEADPPVKWDKIPILVVGGGRKDFSSSSATHPPLKWDIYPISVVGPPPLRLRTPPTTEMGITPYMGCVPCARWAETNFPAVLN